MLRNLMLKEEITSTKCKSKSKIAPDNITSPKDNENPIIVEEFKKSKSIPMLFKPRLVKKLPKRTKTFLPKSNLRSIKRQQKANVFASFIISLLIMVGSFYETESIYQNNYVLTVNSNITRIVVCGLACIQIMLVFLYYYTSLKVKISYKEVNKHSVVYQDKDTFKGMMLEIVICCFVIPPYVNFTLIFPQISQVEVICIDEIMIPLIFLRAFHVFKMVYEFNYANSLKARFYCDLQMVLSPFLFSLRSTLKKHPLYSNMAMFTLSTLLLGILLHIYERSVDSSPFGYIWNAFWIISYTQSTIGYGDIVPLTHLGRASIIICSFIGIFLYSYTVLIVQNLSSINNSEQKLYTEIKYKFKGVHKLKKYSLVLLQRWWKLQMKRRIGAKRINDVFKYQNQLKRFTFKRLMETHEQCPMLTDEIENISQRVGKKMQDINKHLQKISLCTSMSTKYLNIHYAMVSKLKHFKRNVRRFHHAPAQVESELLMIRNKSKNSSVCMSKAKLKIVREDAVKKLLEKKIIKPSFSNCSMVLGVSEVSSDEDFYSSRN